MLHAFAHLAPDGVLAVEKACVVEADEELAVGAVGALRTRHRADAADMRFAAELGGPVGLVGAAHASAGRVAALRHEAVDDAVDDDAVRTFLPGELPDPPDTPGGGVGAQADDDVPAATVGGDG